MERENFMWNESQQYKLARYRLLLCTSWCSVVCVSCLCTGHDREPCRKWL